MGQSFLLEFSSEWEGFEGGGKGKSRDGGQESAISCMVQVEMAWEEILLQSGEKTCKSSI